MTTYQPAVPPPPVDQNGVVVADLPCRKCAYNLRTLSITGRCPECGTAVGYSAQGDLLRFSDPTWVMTLHRGVVLILCGIAVIIFGTILAVVLAFGIAERFAELLGTVVALGGYGLMVIGSWLLTMPDPSGLGEDRYGTVRKVIRVTLLIGIAEQVLELLNAGFALPDAVRMLFLILQGVTGLVGIVGTYAQLQYIEKLALRIPDERINTRANFLKKALVGTYAALFVGGVILALLGFGRGGAGGAGAGGAFVAVGCVMGIVGIAALVFAVMYLFMLNHLRKALKEQAQYALQTWAAGAAAPAM